MTQQPWVGMVKHAVGGVEAASGQAAKHPTRATQRPRGSQPSGVGLRVVLAAIPGITRKGLLGSPFVFQCPPLAPFTHSGDFTFTDFATVGGETRTRPDTLTPRQCSFDTLFVDGDYHWTLTKRTNGFAPSPQDMARELWQLRASGSVFRLMVYHPPEVYDHFEVNWPATLRSLSLTENDGEPDAKYANLQFVEYMDDNVPAFGENLPSKLPYSTTVKNLNPLLDSLTALATRFYGDPSKWRVIAQASGLHHVPPNGSIKSYFKNSATKRITVPRVAASTKGAQGKRAPRTTQRGR